MNTVPQIPCLATLLMMACTSSVPTATIQLPQSLSIASITVVGSTDSNTWTPENPTNVSLSCNGAPLLVATAPQLIDSAIDGFTLTVPGGCGTLVSCGWLALRVEPQPPTQGTETDIDTWTSPIVVDGIELPGTYNIAVELHDASDNVLHASDGKVFGDQVTLELLESSNCSATGIADAG
jgi:hypothetical protein